MGKPRDAHNGSHGQHRQRCILLQPTVDDSLTLQRKRAVQTGCNTASCLKGAVSNRWRDRCCSALHTVYEKLFSFFAQFRKGKQNSTRVNHLGVFFQQKACGRNLAQSLQTSRRREKKMWRGEQVKRQFQKELCFIWMTRQLSNSKFLLTFSFTLCFGKVCILE